MIDPIHEPNLIAEIKDISKRTTALERYGRRSTVGQAALTHAHGQPDNIRLDGYWMNTAWTGYRPVYEGSVYVMAPILAVPMLWDLGFVTGPGLTVSMRVTAFNTRLALSATIYEGAGLGGFGVTALPNMADHFGPHMGDLYLISIALRVPAATGGTFRWRPDPLRWSGSIA